jgi:hypothetical protein
MPKAKTMKLSEFVSLSETEKKLAVLHHGVLIGKRTDAGRFIFLFQVENYYVEAFCNTTNRSVEEFRMFTGITCLFPYLEMITLDDLLKGK